MTSVDMLRDGDEIDDEIRQEICQEIECGPDEAIDEAIDEILEEARKGGRSGSLGDGIDDLDDYIGDYLDDDVQVGMHDDFDDDLHADVHGDVHDDVDDGGHDDARADLDDDGPSGPEPEPALERRPLASRARVRPREDAGEATLPAREERPAKHRRRRGGGGVWGTVCAACAVVGAYLAGAIVGGETVDALPLASLAALLALLPGALVLASARRWSRVAGSRSHGDHAAGGDSATLEECRALLEESLARAETVETRFEKVRAEIETELHAAFARREEQIVAKAQKDLEKVRVFFETLLEKHVHRINRELRQREAELAELRDLDAAREGDADAAARLAKGAERLTEKVEELESELERVQGEIEQRTAEVEALRAELEAERDGGGGDADSDQAGLHRPRRAGPDSRRNFFRGVSTLVRNHLQIARKLTADVTARVPASTGDDLTAHDDVAKIRSHLDCLDHLTSQLVDLEKLESANWKSVYSEVAVREVLDRAAEGFRELAREKGVKLQVRVPKRMDDVCLDQTLLSRALKEIVGNAVAYTDTGGFVSISASLDGDGDDGVLSVRVKDSGKGIAEEDRERIFEAFEQGEKPRFSLVGAGAGLGLTLARGYVYQLGGEIHIESEPGRGSTFTITVPVRGEE